MNDFLSLVLSKAVKSDEYKKASSQIEAGEYNVEFVVRIKGKLLKGEDYEQRIVSKANPWSLFAVALDKLHGASINSLVKAALDPEKEEEVEEVKKKVQKAMDKLKEPTKIKCNGRVTTKLEVEKISGRSRKKV